MARWDPWREIRRMQDTMDRLWPWGGAETGAGDVEAWSVPLDVVEDADHITVSAVVPGIDPGQIECTIDDNVLTIGAERNEQRESREGRYLVRESRAGTFRRSVRLPNVIDAEQAESEYKNGVLTVRFPKQEQKRARRIEVKAGEAQGQLGTQAQQEERQAA